MSRPSRTDACWIEFDLGGEPGGGGVDEAERLDRHGDVGGEDLDDVVEGGVGVVDAGEQLQQRDSVGRHGAADDDRGAGEEEPLEVVRAGGFRFAVVGGVLDALDDDEPTGGMVELDPPSQRVTAGELQVVFDDPGEVEQWFQVRAVGEIVEGDPEALPHQSGEPVTHRLGGFDVLENLEHDAVGGNRCQELGPDHVVRGQIDERPSRADERVEADLGDRVHQHARGCDVAIDELGGRGCGSVAEEQLVADRVQGPIQDGLAPDEQVALFVNTSLFVNARRCSHWTVAR